MGLFNLSWNLILDALRNDGNFRVAKSVLHGMGLISEVKSREGREGCKTRAATKNKREREKQIFNKRYLNDV